MDNRLKRFNPTCIDKVITLDDHRPHVCLRVHDGSAHVIACKDIEAFIAGELELADMVTLKVETPESKEKKNARDGLSVVRRIVDEWYQRLMNG